MNVDEMAQQQDAGQVLCVDLDGTLLRTDTLWESLARLLRTAPWQICMLPMWLVRGKAHLNLKTAAF